MRIARSILVACSSVLFVNAHATAQPFHTVGLLDDLETYNTGPLNGQGLWFSEGSVSFIDISFVNPAFGDRTISIRPSASQDRALKLLDVPPAYGRLDFDVWLGDSGQGTAELIEGGSNRVVAYLQFEPGDFIRAKADGFALAMDTGTSYIPNAINRIGMEILPNGTANYYINGNLFFTGQNLTNVAPPTNLGFDEFEFTNTQFVSGSIYIDNLEIVASPTPCAPHVNSDGVLDNGDISAFVTLYLAGDLAADFTNDGILDNGDINAFIIAFLAGC